MISVGMTQFITVNFVKWELALCVLLLLVAFFIGYNRGYRKALMFLAVTVPIVAVALITKYFVYLGFDNPSEAVRLAIAWGPTVMFALVLFTSTLVGIRRGLRKSALLLLHAVCAGAFASAYMLSSCEARHLTNCCLILLTLVWAAVRRCKKRSTLVRNV